MIGRAQYFICRGTLCWKFGYATRKSRVCRLFICWQINLLKCHAPLFCSLKRYPRACVWHNRCKFFHHSDTRYPQSATAKLVANTLIIANGVISKVIFERCVLAFREACGYLKNYVSRRGCNFCLYSLEDNCCSSAGWPLLSAIRFSISALVNSTSDHCSFFSINSLHSLAEKGGRS